MIYGKNYTELISQPTAEVMLANIKALCRIRGITITKLCEKLGMAKSSFSNWKYHSPRAWVVMAIADYFGVTAEALMLDEELPQKYAA